MKKYSISFKCGHIEICKLFDNDIVNAQKVEYYSKNYICKECYKKQNIKVA